MGILLYQTEVSQGEEEGKQHKGGGGVGQVWGWSWRRAKLSCWSCLRSHQELQLYLVTKAFVVLALTVPLELVRKLELVQALEVVCEPGPKLAPQ
jgi:hypothetical protein